MSLLLYAVTASLILLAAHRWIGTLSRAVAIVLFLLPFCFVGRALLTDAVYGPIDIAYATEPLMELREEYGVTRGYTGIMGDLAYQMIPWRKAVQWAISQGEWPLWNPFVLSGDILAASGQPAAYSPFMLIALLLPIGKGLTYSAAIAFFLAALGAYLFARAIGCADVPALITAAGWMYCSAVSFFILWPLGFSWAMFPLVLIAGRLVVHDPCIRTAAVLFTILTLLVLAGHPETVLHVVVVASVYCAMELIAIRRRTGPAIVTAVLAGMAALLATAIYLLPLLEAAEQTIEHAFRTGGYGAAPRGAPLIVVATHVATAFLPFTHLRQWLIEGVRPFSPETAAVGSIVVAAALYAVLRVRSRQTWFFAALAVVGILAGATWAPLSRFLQKLPGFDIAINERLLFAGAFALALLAGIGIDRILAGSGRRDAALVFGAVLLVLSAATFAVVRFELIGAHANRWGDHKVEAELIALGLATLLLLLRMPSRILGPALLALLLLQRTVSELGAYPIYPSRAAYPPIPVLEPLHHVREPFRIAGYNLAFIPGASTLYELEDVRGYQAMTFTPYFELYPLWSLHQPVWFNKVVDLTRPFLSFLNVRYVVQSRNFEVPDGWSIISESSETRIIENSRVIDRVFLPRRLRMGLTPDDARREMAEATDFREVAWIPADGPPGVRMNATGHLAFWRVGTRYGIDATLDDDGWIVVSEKAWKGWRAYIDGRRVKTTVANTAFLSVFVPRGEHRVLLMYLPDSFVRGRTISFLTLASIFVFALIRWVLRRRRSSPLPS